MSEKRSRGLDWLVRLCGLSAACIGAIWLVLWTAGVPARWTDAGRITVKTNMALGLTIGAVSLLLLANEMTKGARRWLGAALALVVLLIGGVTLSEHVFRYDAGIDQILATEEPGAVATAAPNRMSPPGSLSLALLGAALLAGAVGRRSWAPYLAIPVCLVNMAPLIGYLYGAKEFFSKPNLTGIAWPTVAAMLALATGLIASVRRTGPTVLLMQDDPGGLMLRRLLPALVVVPVILGWLRMQGQYRGWYDTPGGAAWFVLGVIILLAALLWRNAESLSRNAAESRTAAEALHESEKKYRDLFESIDQGFCTIEVLFDVNEKPIDYRFLMVNPAFERQTGIPGATGRRMSEIAPLHEEHWFQFYGRIVLTGEPMRFENAAIQLQRYYEVFAWRIGAPSDRMVAVLFNDVSERRRAEVALRESEELLRLAQEAGSIGAFALDLRTGANTWSPKLEELYGLPVGSFERTQAGWENLIHPDDRSVVARSVRAAFETSEAREAEFRVIWPDGSVHWLSGRWQSVKDASGAPLRLTGVNIDITERKHAEERLRQAQKLESLGLLAGGVAHDFNNLLVGVIGNASLAHEMLPPDHPVAELAQTIVKAGEQAAHLTRQMLAYSGKGKFLVESLDLSALAHDVIELVAPSISKKIVLKFDRDEDLPAIEADRGQVQQIIMNIVINAAEAIGNHDGQITVLTGTRYVNEEYCRRHPEAADIQPGRYAVLEVHDTGCGMDGAVKAKIFDPFFSTKFTGRGLGLAAVAGIVRGHHGAIVVTSAPGRGSTFTVLLPLPAQPIKERPSAAQRNTSQRSGVVLVIDDEQVVRDMAKRTLERQGYTVLVAESGRAAIDILKRHPGNVDIALLDLSMPGMSGEETLPELRRIRPEVKVFVSSGYSEAEAMTMFRGQRVSGFVQKPYRSTVLVDKVSRAL